MTLTFDYGDAMAVLEAECGKHPVFCFTYRGEPIGWDVTNTAWQTALRKADIPDFRFHDLRHYAAPETMPG